MKKEWKLKKSKTLELSCMIKKEYIIPIRNLKQALNHELVLKKVHSINKFNLKVRVKSFIDINTELRRKTNNDFEKELFKLMNMEKLWKIFKNIGTRNL